MKILTTQQAAEMLQVSEKTLGKLKKEGKIQYSQIGRIVRFREEDISQFMESNRVALTPSA